MSISIIDLFGQKISFISIEIGIEQTKLDREHINENGILFERTITNDESNTVLSLKYKYIREGRTITHGDYYQDILDKLTKKRD